MSNDLDVQIRERLDRRRGDWKVIASRADVSHSWISQFVRGLIPNPGYMTLKKLSAALDAGDQQAATSSAKAAA